MQTYIKRPGSVYVIDTQIDNMFKVEATIYCVAYHAGGAMNGVCVCRFLEQSTFLMERIKVMAYERRNVNSGHTRYDNRCTNEELQTKLDTYS